MKTDLIGMKVLFCAAAFATALMTASPSLKAEDLNATFQQGRAAFYRGDFATAKQLLTRVAAVNPKHEETANMLAYIRVNYKEVDTTLQKQYATVILPKVEFSDVTLTEAMDGLRALAKNASNGKVVPNVIIRGEEVAQRKLSLSLANIPLTEALNYATQMANAKATYDKHAVIVSGAADTAVSAAEAAKPERK